MALPWDWRPEGWDSSPDEITMEPDYLAEPAPEAELTMPPDYLGDYGQEELQMPVDDLSAEPAPGFDWGQALAAGNQYQAPPPPAMEAAPAAAPAPLPYAPENEIPYGVPGGQVGPSLPRPVDEFEVDNTPYTFEERQQLEPGSPEEGLAAREEFERINKMLPEELVVDDYLWQRRRDRQLQNEINAANSDRDKAAIANEAQAQRINERAQLDLKQWQEEGNRMAQQKPDRYRYARSLSTPEKIANIITAGLDGLVAPYYGGRNPTLERLQGEIDRDLQLQGMEMDRAIDMHRQQGATQQQILNLEYEKLKQQTQTAQAHYERTIRQIQEKAMQYDPASTMAREALKLTDKVRAQRAASEAQAEKDHVEFQLKEAELHNKQLQNRKLEGTLGAGGLGVKSPLGNPKDPFDPYTIYTPKELGPLTVPALRDEFDRPFVASTIKGAENLRHMNASVNQFVGIVDRMDKLRRKVGWSNPVTEREERAELESLAEQAVYVVKNMEELGALDKGTGESTTRVLGDPTSILDGDSLPKLKSARRMATTKLRFAIQGERPKAPIPEFLTPDEADKRAGIVRGDAADHQYALKKAVGPEDRNNPYAVDEGLTALEKAARGGDETAIEALRGVVAEGGKKAKARAQKILDSLETPTVKNPLNGDVTQLSGEQLKKMKPSKAEQAEEKKKAAAEEKKVKGLWGLK